MSDINVIKMTYMFIVKTQYKEKEKEMAIDKPNSTTYYTNTKTK